MGSPRRALRSRLAVVGAAMLAGVLGLVATFGIPVADSPLTYAQASDLARVVGLAAGVTLLIVGVVAAVLAHRPQMGLLLIAVSAVWFAQDLEALGDDAALLRRLATGAAPLAAALILHLVLTTPGRRLARGERAVVLAGYGVAVVAGAGIVLLRDPFFDVYCWRQCRPDSAPIAGHPDAADAIRVLALWASAVTCAAAISIAAQRLLAASPGGRRLLGPALIALALTGSAELARAITLLTSPVEDPLRDGFLALHLIRAGALLLLAVGVAWVVLRLARARRRVSRLAADLGAAPPPGKLRAALVAALGDPTVEVLYWLPGSGRCVDAEGKPRTPPAEGTTAITRAGRPLAVIVHETAALDGEALERALGPAARLAIENEALRAEVLSQLEQLRASRARIVATADDARRRLERDLHDGAQQRLLAVALEVRLARGRADGEVGARLDRVGQALERSFGELRELAHGIFPAVLTEAGLDAALATLADSAPLAVELGEITQDRLPAAVEAGAYVAVDEAIRDAAARGATVLDISAGVEDRRLVVTAEDDGAPRADGLVHVVDRVGALGGEVRVTARRLRAEIPCG
jgi:signal transduction histidine kinase